MSEFIAYVTKIEPKHGTGKNGKPYTVYNVFGLNKAGEEVRVGWGFDAPSFGTNLWIKTTLEQNGRYLNYKGAHVEVKPGPAPVASTASTGSTAATGGAGSTDTQNRIMYQNSRSAAIEVTGLLLQYDSLPVSGAKGKAGEAKRFEQVLDFVNKLTVQFYHDVGTLRLLETVADAGDVEVAARGELPDEVEEPTPPAEEEEFNDDIPF